MLIKHYKRYLPHIEGAEYQMITYRLSDSLPKKALLRLKQFSQEDQHEKIEELMAQGFGSCILAIPEVANEVISSWIFYDQKRYDVLAYVVMPNHVHILIKVYKNETLATIVKSWKSFSARKIQSILPKLNKPALEPIWQKDYWDRYIRDKDHFYYAMEYIHKNPTKAGLVKKPEDWTWSSAYK